jgi:DNA-binding response OmpR family regulator
LCQGRDRTWRGAAPDGNIASNPGCRTRSIRSRILIIDDDRELAAMLAEFLDLEGFDVVVAFEAPEPPLELPPGPPPDLVVLDVMLPGRSGFELLRELRAREARLPILMLTARGDAVDRILGLELGADDYLSKPFDPRELAARIRAVLRRASTPAQAADEDEDAATELRAGPLLLDLARRRADLGGEALELTAAEFRVLARLVRDAGRLVSRAELTEDALGRKLTLYDRAIDTHVSNLRRKLERAAAARPATPREAGAPAGAGAAPGIEIRSVRGAGYELLTGAPR